MGELIDFPALRPLPLPPCERCGLAFKPGEAGRLLPGEPRRARHLGNCPNATMSTAHGRLVIARSVLGTWTPETLEP